VSGFGVTVGILAMIVSRGRVLLSLFLVAVVVVMSGLAVVMGGCLMLRSRVVMMLARRVLLLFRHGRLLLRNKIHDVSGQSARLPRHKPWNKKPTWSCAKTKAFDHVGLLFDEPPSMAGLFFNLSSDYFVLKI
jgi:hypothetical protein